MPGTKTRAAALFVGAFAAMGATSYVAPHGNDSSGDGSINNPWLRVSHAVTQTAMKGAAGDTLFVWWGLYDGNRAPFNITIIDSAFSGVTGDYTMIIGLDGPDGERAIFDAESLYTADGDEWAINFKTNSIGQPVDHLGVKNLVFRDYGDDSGAGASWLSGRGTIYTQNNDTTATDIPTGFLYEDLRFEANDLDSIAPAFTFTDAQNLELPGHLGRIDSVRVVDCYAEKVGAAIVDVPAVVRHFQIERGYYEGAIALQPGKDFFVEGPNGFQFLRDKSDSIWIAGPEITAVDHGMELRGSVGTVWKAYIHDITDDYIWVHDDTTAARTSGWLLQEIVGHSGQDEGFEVQGANHGIYGCTLSGVGDWLIAFSDGGGGAPTDITVQNCIFVDSNGSPESVGDRAVFLATGHSGIRVFDNVFFDRDATLTVQDQDDGTVTTIADLNAEAYGNNNVELDPMLADTTNGANLRPFAASPAKGRGMPGRLMAGGLECADCLKVPLTISGIYPDSVRAEIRNQYGQVVREVPFLGLHQLDPGSRYLVDVEPDSSLYGRVMVQGWSYEGGDRDPAPFTTDYLAIDPAPVQIAQRTETQLADDFASIDVGEVDITAQDIADIATAAADEVWSSSDMRTRLIDSFSEYPGTLDGAVMDSIAAATLFFAILENANFAGRQSPLSTAAYEIAVKPTAVETASAVDDSLAAEFAQIPIDVWARSLAGVFDATAAGQYVKNIFTDTDAIDADRSAGGITTDVFNHAGYSQLLVDADAAKDSLLVLTRAFMETTIRDSLISRGGSGPWTSATIDSATAVIIAGAINLTGNGAFSHFIGVKSTADSSAVSGAHLRVYNAADGVTRYVDTLTPTNGLVEASLDSAITYQLRVSSPTTYNGITQNFTVTGDSDTTTVYLLPIQVLAPADPDKVAFVFDSFDIFGEAQANAIVEIRLQSGNAVESVDGLNVETTWAVFDTTDVEGRATRAVYQSDLYDGGPILYQFRIAGAQLPLVERVYAPNDTTAAVATYRNCADPPNCP